MIVLFNWNRTNQLSLKNCFVMMDIIRSLFVARYVKTLSIQSIKERPGKQSFGYRYNLTLRILLETWFTFSIKTYTELWNTVEQSFLPRYIWYSDCRELSFNVNLNHNWTKFTFQFFVSGKNLMKSLQHYWVSLLKKTCITM